MLGNIKSREYMFVVRLRNYLHLSFLVIFLLFSSCIDEFYKDTPKEGYITITGINTRAYTGAIRVTGSMIRLKLCVFWLSIRQVASAKVILFIMEMCWAEIRYGIRLIRVNMILSFWPMNLIIQL